MIEKTYDITYYIDNGLVAPYTKDTTGLFRVCDLDLEHLGVVNYYVDLYRDKHNDLFLYIENRQRIIYYLFKWFGNITDYKSIGFEYRRYHDPIGTFCKFMNFIVSDQKATSIKYNLR